VIDEPEAEGHTPLVIGGQSDDGIGSSFVPSAGMVGCSLRHRGEELLGQRGGVARYIAERGTMEFRCFIRGRTAWRLRADVLAPA
jgi:hypothetical protein